MPRQPSKIRPPRGDLGWTSGGYLGVRRSWDDAGTGEELAQEWCRNGVGTVQRRGSTKPADDFSDSANAEMSQSQGKSMSNEQTCLPLRLNRQLGACRPDPKSWPQGRGSI
jgi:hypothetical protein